MSTSGSCWKISKALLGLGGSLGSPNTPESGSHLLWAFPKVAQDRDREGNWGKRQRKGGALQCVSPTAWEVNGGAGTGLWHLCAPQVSRGTPMCQSPRMVPP